MQCEEMWKPRIKYRRRKNDWKVELRTHMDSVKFLNVKGNNNLKTLEKMLVSDYDFDDTGQYTELS